MFLRRFAPDRPPCCHLRCRHGVSPVFWSILRVPQEALPFDTLPDSAAIDHLWIVSKAHLRLQTEVFADVLVSQFGERDLDRMSCIQIDSVVLFAGNLVVSAKTSSRGTYRILPSDSHQYGALNFWRQIHRVEVPHRF